VNDSDRFLLRSHGVGFDEIDRIEHETDARIAELEAIRDAEREVHIREIESWERVHRAMIDERDAAMERVAELEAALEGVVAELVGQGYFWIIKDKAIKRARDALAKETR